MKSFSVKLWGLTESADFENNIRAFFAHDGTFQVSRMLYSAADCWTFALTGPQNTNWQVVEEKLADLADHLNKIRDGQKRERLFPSWEVAPHQP